MTRLRNNKTLFIIIITAFLAVQWSTAHIHLAEHHDHDGSHHKHASQGHLHELASHHIDAIDVSHADSHENIVELDHESTSPAWNKLDDHPDALTQVIGYLERQAHAGTICLSISNEPDSSWLSYSTVRLRAPPQFTS